MSRQLPADYEKYELRKIKLGIRMTILYAAVYAGFIALSVFQPGLMGSPFILGQNLAVTYGLGLIVIAILFAMIYNYLLRVPKPDKGSGQKAKQTPDRKGKGQ